MGLVFTDQSLHYLKNQKSIKCKKYSSQKHIVGM